MLSNKSSKPETNDQTLRFDPNASRDKPFLIARLVSDSSFHSALFTFVLTRAIVFALFIITSQINQPGQLNRIGELQSPVINLTSASAIENLKHVFAQTDCAWYQGIAQNGYEHTPFDSEKMHNWAFFPLFPLIWRIAATITGEYLFTGIALANIFCLLAFIVLHKTVQAFGFSKDEADRTVFFAGIFPTSYFFSIPMTESLFLLLTVGSFYAAKREHWALAGFVGALATATRLVGILLLPALVILYWQRYRNEQKSYAKALGLLLIPLGLYAYMLHLYWLTGNPLAFMDVQAAWGRSTGLFVIPLLEYLRNPLEISNGWDFKLLNFAVAATAFLSAIVLIKWREWALAFFTLAGIVLPLSSLSLQALSRYALPLFPIFIVLAVFGRNAKINSVIQTILITLLTLMTVLFIATFATAMA